MNEVADFCPFEPAGRADRCIPCTAASALAPCASNWLRARLTHDTPVAVVRDGREAVRRAA